MQTDPQLRTCRISEKLVRFLMFFRNNGYRVDNRTPAKLKEKKSRFLACSQINLYERQYSMYCRSCQIHYQSTQFRQSVISYFTSNSIYSLSSEKNRHLLRCFPACQFRQFLHKADVCRDVFALTCIFWFGLL